MFRYANTQAFNAQLTMSKELCEHNLG
jgi:hypothetical protein